MKPNNLIEELRKVAGDKSLCDSNVKDWGTDEEEVRKRARKNEQTVYVPASGVYVTYKENNTPHCKNNYDPT